MYIIKLWILEKKNCNEIYNKIKEESVTIVISKEKIRALLKVLRICISHYIKDTYIIENISIRNEYAYYAVDESDFIKLNGNILWVIGIINTHNKNLRLEVSYTRNADIIKKIIKTHIQTGNIIISDGWSGYHWLDQPFSGYIHSTHNHAAGDFGLGLDSTSHIESVWNQLKYYIKSLYNIIPSEDFILYLGEAEFRRNINSLENDKKLSELFSILNYIRDIEINNLYSIDKLYELTEK